MKDRLADYFAIDACFSHNNKHVRTCYIQHTKLKENVILVSSLFSSFQAYTHPREYSPRDNNKIKNKRDVWKKKNSSPTHDIGFVQIQLAKPKLLINII